MNLSPMLIHQIFLKNICGFSLKIKESKSSSGTTKEKLFANLFFRGNPAGRNIAAKCQLSKQLQRS